MKGSCFVCNSKKVYYDFTLLQKFRIEECRECGLMRLNPFPSEQEVQALSTEQYYDETLDNKSASYYLSLVSSDKNNDSSASLLEIGCREGHLLLKAIEKGMKVTGVGFSQHSVNVTANKIGDKGEIIACEPDKLSEIKGAFDYIVLNDVLQKVKDPKNILRCAYQLLNEDGIILIIVPSLDSMSARLMKKKWVEFRPSRFWYFSTKTLSRLLYHSNFSQVRVAPVKKTVHIEYLSKRFQSYPVEPFCSLVSFMRRILPESLSHYPFQIAASNIAVFARKSKVNSTKKLSVVMPVYNEAPTVKLAIDRVLTKKIPNLDIELIIIESGSTDGTQDIIRQYDGSKGVTILWQDKPSGKGNATRAGFEYITGDFVLIQDSDDEYDIEDYDVLLEPLMTGEAAFVLGARHGGKAWKMRQFDEQVITGHILNLGHWFFTALINIALGLRLKDPFTMYKVFRTDCLKGLKFDANRFDFDFELLIKLVRSGYKPIEIPVNYRSRSFKEGKKVKIFRDPLTWLRAIVKYRFQKLN